jgi:hypothetical protein
VSIDRLTGCGVASLRCEGRSTAQQQRNAAQRSRKTRRTQERYLAASN